MLLKCVQCNADIKYKMQISSKNRCCHTHKHTHTHNNDLDLNNKHKFSKPIKYSINEMEELSIA